MLHLSERDNSRVDKCLQRYTAHGARRGGRWALPALLGGGTGGGIGARIGGNRNGGGASGGGAGGALRAAQRAAGELSARDLADSLGALFGGVQSGEGGRHLLP